MRLPHVLVSGLVLILIAALNLPAVAAEAEVKAEVEKSAVPDGLASPRATMRTYLDAITDVKAGQDERMDAVVSTLDLSDINVLIRRERGEDLAWLLLDVLDKTRLVKFEKIPRRTTGKPWVFERYQAGAIQIRRVEDGRWLFDRATITALPAIHEELADKQRVVGDAEDISHLPWHLRFRQGLPAVLKHQSFVLENWLWLGLLLIVALGIFVDWLVRLVLRTLVRSWRSRAEHRDYSELPDGILRPMGLMAMAVVWWLGINLLGLPEQALLVLLVAVKFLASAAGVWAAYRLVDLVAVWLTVRSRYTENKIDDVLAPLVPRTLKVFVTVVGVVFIADNLNIDITGLVAGLGLGGLAFALASKDMVQNLFGSFTILLDRTFTVGDWIKVGDQEGSVERIGFRSTRIRTFYNSMLTVPNSHFITANVDNMGERRYRRLSTKFGLTYDTPPEKVDAFCEGVREIVRQHPYMRKDYFHVYLNGLGDSSLEVLIYVFWETPDWSTELRERHRFLLDCLRLAEQLGVEYAFPTQTLYLRQDSGPDTSGEPGDRDDLVEQARRQARSIVEQNTGLGQRPPPVSFN